ncbi:MAG: non-ribosomal peptide synthetase [Betaproteobacteria bacterium]|nr:non-ribosomal peptide synthetase [Betaproteobacteria bacterium]
MNFSALDARSAPAAKSGAAFALTVPQTAIWLDQALYPGKPIYNTGQTITISADLDTPRFREALRRTVDEADALRLRFFQQTDGIFQETASGIVPDVAIRDFSKEADPQRAADDWIEQTFWRALTPSTFPLFEFALVRVAVRRYLWLQKYHHLVIDATGRQLVARRVAEIYAALERGEEPAGARALPYRAAKEAEDQYLSSSQYGVDDAYWRQRFAALPDAVVPADVQCSERLRSGRPARLDCEVTQAQSAALRAFATRHSSTAFKVILALVWSCFSRFYQRADLIIGVAIANRSPAVRHTVGLFSKVLPYRAQFAPDMSLGSALAKLDADLSGDLQHQRFPTDHISRFLQLRRIDRAGLYDIAVNYVRNDYTFDFAGAPIACDNLSAGFSVPWRIMALEYGHDSPIRILIDYDHGRIPSDEADRVFQSLRGMLTGVAGLADTAIGRIAADLDPARRPARGAAPASAQPVPAPVAPLQHQPPCDDVEERLAALWRQHLPGKTFGVRDDFFELGGDSLGTLLLGMQYQECFGVEVPLAVQFECRTIERLAVLIREHQQHEPPSGLVPLREGGTGVPLLLVHPIGGTVFCYRDLASRMTPGYPIYGLQAPGLRDGETVPDTLEALASGYLRSAAAVAGNGPVHLAGWSFGGLVAFEMAQQLAQAAGQTATLTLIDTPSRLGFQGEDEEQSLALRAVVGAAGSAPLAEEQIQRMVRLVSDLRRLRARYTPLLLDTSLTLLRAASEARLRDEDFDWTRLVAGVVKVVPVSATHDSIVYPPAVDDVAKVLGEVIKGWQRLRGEPL